MRRFAPAVGVLSAITAALLVLCGCSSGSIDRTHTVLGCDMPEQPGNAARSDWDAQVPCASREIAARACHVSTSDVDQALGRTAVGNDAVLGSVGHNGRVVATLQSPYNGGGELIVAVRRPASPPAPSTRTSSIRSPSQVTQPTSPRLASRCRVAMARSRRRPPTTSTIEDAAQCVSASSRQPRAAARRSITRGNASRFGRTTSSAN